MRLELRRLGASSGRGHRPKVSSIVALLVVAGTAGVGAPGAAAKTNGYVATKLVSDLSGVATTHDPLLVNAWGLAAQPSSPWWVADNGTGVATVYQADGSPASLVVQVPGLPESSGSSGPSGVVANSGQGFLLGQSVPATFLFATVTGEILGWNPTVSLDQAVVASATPGAVYTGLAIASNAGADFLYAADFADGRIDVFDDRFQQVTTAGGFLDPNLPAGFVPFGIQNVNGAIVVTYARQAADGSLVEGDGLGVVDAFDPSGTLLARLASGGQLNAPWGVARAPAKGFGRFSGDLLVGNHGDGRITAFEPKLGGKLKPIGQLANADGTAMAIDALWALQFGRGSAANGATTTLFFTAGPHLGADGLFGSIAAR